jgi:hypothetical protein
MSDDAEAGHAVQWRVPAHHTYPAMSAQAALHRGLDGALSATLAQPAGQAM